jgi:hypothetical protein
MVSRWRENLGSQLDLRTLAVAGAKRKCGLAYTPLMECFGTLASVSLQHGVPLKVLCDKLSHTRFVQPEAIISGTTIGTESASGVQRTRRPIPLA